MWARRRLLPILTSLVLFGAGATASVAAISIGDAKVTEGDSGTRRATFRVALANAGAATVTVRYATRDGSATAPADYRAASGSVILTGNLPEADVTIFVNGDTAAEGDEFFFVELSNASGASILDGRGRGTIRDDDGAPAGATRLEAVGALERTLAAGGSTDLAVRATRADGSLAAGAVVEWTVAGDAELLGGATSVADAAGVAAKTVVMGGDTPTVSVSAGSGSATPVTFVLRRQSGFGTLFDPEDQPGPASVAGVLDELCAEPGNRLAVLCRYLGDLTPDDTRRAIEQLTPAAAGAQGAVAIETARAGLRSVNERQRQLRRAARRGAATVTLDLSLPGASQAPASSPGASRFPGLTMEMVPAGARGGPRLDETDLDAALERVIADAGSGAAVDGAGGRAAPQETAAEAEVGAEETRGGFFLSGRLSQGDRDATSRDAGLDYDAAGGTLGVDYRFGARTFLGLAAGYGDASADFAAGGGDLSLEAESLTSYLTYAGDRFFLDLVAGYGRDSYSLRRRLTLPTGAGATIVTGVGEPDGDERAAELGFGWDIAAGASTWTISGRGSYVAVSIDRFVETLSAGGIQFEIFDQDVESILAEAAIEWTHAASFDWGVLQPQISAAARHEFEDDAHEVRGRFVGDPAGGEFTLPTEPADATYFAAKAGATAIFPGGFALYANLEQEFGRDGLSVSTLSAGLRFEW